MRLSVPASLNIGLKIGVGSVTQMAFSLDCLLVDMGDNLVEPYNKIYVNVLCAIVFLMLFNLSQLLIGKFRKERPMTGIITTSILYMFIYMQPSLFEQESSLLSTRKISGEYYI